MKDLEDNKIQRELMSEKEFQEYIHNRIMPLELMSYLAVGRYKSVRRAIRRGHVTYNGVIMPSRPFSNKSNSCKRGKHSRIMNEEKKKIYARIKDYRRKHSND